MFPSMRMSKADRVAGTQQGEICVEVGQASKLWVKLWLLSTNNVSQSDVQENMSKGK